MFLRICIVTCISDYRRVGFVNRFTEHVQVITTNKYNTIADSHTTNNSTLSLLNLLYVVTALHSGYSSAVSSLERFLVTNFSDEDSSVSIIRWLTLHS
jgi:hypothetical protein